MIKEDIAEEEDMHMTGDDLRQAAAGMQTNGTSPEKLEDGELDEEAENAQAYPDRPLTESSCVRGKRIQFHMVMLTFQ